MIVEAIQNPTQKPNLKNLLAQDQVLHPVHHQGPVPDPPHHVLDPEGEVTQGQGQGQLIGLIKEEEEEVRPIPGLAPDPDLPKVEGDLPDPVPIPGGQGLSTGVKEQLVSFLLNRSWIKTSGELGS